MIPAAETESGQDPAAAVSAAQPASASLAKRRRRHGGLGTRLFLVLLAFSLTFAAFGLSGKAISLPVWAVAEIEQRINRGLSTAMPDIAVSLGGVDFQIDTDWVPTIRVDDLRLLKSDGGALLSLPDIRVTLDPTAVLHGQIRPRRLRLIGAQLKAVRDPQGHFDFSFGEGRLAPQINSFAELFDAADAAFSLPVTSGLISFEAEALTLTLTDQGSGRVWDMGDGRLRLDNRADALAAEVSMSLVGGGVTPAHAVVQVITDKGADRARVTATISGVAAQDLAAQAAPLAWLGVLDAPISGQLATSINAHGITSMEAQLDIGAGALKPNASTRPIAFDRAAIALNYDPAQGRINLTGLSVDSPSMRLAATGQTYLMQANGAPLTGALASDLPAAFLGQIHISQAMFDPEGLFQEPLRFSDGALDARLQLNPFRLDIGQFALTEGPRRLLATGKVTAEPEGWRVAVDMSLNEISQNRLLALWPQALLPGTRAWIEKNVLEGALHDVRAALRIAPKSEPRLHLGYGFDHADVRFLATLPPVIAGSGYSTLDGTSYTMVLDTGTVTPPQGGQIDVAGSVFAVSDVTKRPAQAQITLKTRSSLTASLSLLDQPPFHFMSKADRPVEMGQGQAMITTHLSLPLQKRVSLTDVSYDVAGEVTGFASDVLVPGRPITSDRVEVRADKTGLSIFGPGKIGSVPFDATFTQGFAPDQRGKSSVEGSVTLTQSATEEFGLGLPSGMVSGQGKGQVSIKLQRDAPGELTLTSDLQGIGLSIPEIGWTKASAAKGKLSVAVQMAKPPRVTDLTLVAAGLTMQGNVTLRPGGGLDAARFDKVKLDDWLNATMSIKGRGKGQDVALEVTGGSVDLRRMPDARRRKVTARASTPMQISLDRLQISAGIALTGFRGTISQTGGTNGDFSASVNGRGAVRGTIAPSPNGTGVRLHSNDAGTVLAAAGLFTSARGGALDLTLVPQAGKGIYDGKARITTVRVRNANVLAELLNAISVVGILEQLNGDGLVFNEAEADFLLTPKAIQIIHGSAIGASLGVSMAGVYQSAADELTMQGVISPIYLLNGIGAIFTRRGEGLFGFNYSLRGKASDPQVSVNPLSILTPGMFREIFRAPAPVLKKQGNGG